MTTADTETTQEEQAAPAPVEEPAAPAPQAEAPEEAGEAAAIEAIPGARRRRGKRMISHGQVHIKATFNNTILTITDQDGKVAAVGDDQVAAAAARRLDECEGSAGEFVIVSAGFDAEAEEAGEAGDEG